MCNTHREKDFKTQEGPALSLMNERPSIGKPTSLSQGIRQHKAQGFSRYTGKKLKGPRSVLEYGQAGYPECLLSIPTPPKKLFVIGSTQILEGGLAIVGARKATPYGLSCARKFSRIAALNGVVVVSGGARGCDAQAHRGALDAKAPTVVVLGSGCDEIYPAEHAELFQEVINLGGAIISEQEWQFPPLPYTFRSRNRIIAGLTKASLIVEASLPSGTFSTADAALEAGREVLAIPGAITSKTSQGCNHLISQGAHPIISEKDFQEFIADFFEITAATPDEEKEQLELPLHDVQHQRLQKGAHELLLALRAQPARADELRSWVETGKIECTVTKLNRMLIDVQRRDLIVQYPDGRYGPH